jgi:hypothetical protein
MDKQIELVILPHGGLWHYRVELDGRTVRDSDFPGYLSPKIAFNDGMRALREIAKRHDIKLTTH